MPIRCIGYNPPKLSNLEASGAAAGHGPCLTPPFPNPKRMEDSLLTRQTHTYTGRYQSAYSFSLYGTPPPKQPVTWCRQEQGAKGGLTFSPQHVYLKVIDQRKPALM